MGKKLMGMTATIFRGTYDSENSVFHGKTEVTVIGPGIPELHEPDEERPAVVLVNKSGRLAAYPLDHANKWYMFGGCFVYSGDSRFPGPIYMHDYHEAVLQSGD